MEAVVDVDGNLVIDSNSRPLVKTPNQGRAPIYVPDGLVHHALPFINDNGVFLRGFHPFCTEAGEVELATILYVL